VGFAHLNCGPVDVNLVDTPGFVDFFAETKLALVAADAAVIVIEPDPGRVVQTAAVVEHLEARSMPHLFFVNKLDRPGADFEGTLAALRSAYGPHVVATHLPIGGGDRFGGYIDLATQRADRSHSLLRIFVGCAGHINVEHAGEASGGRIRNC